MENLESVIESVVFVAGEAVSVADLCVKFDVKPKEVEKAVNNLKKKYDEKSGIQILFFNNKIQFSSNPKNVDYVTAVLNPIRQRNLTKATLETIAIVAYKQPVTRLEIEEIRGVNSDYALNVLLEHKLIEIVGRKDTVGKPSLFGTTDEFLKRFDISSVSDLPKYEDLMAQIEKIRETYSDSLFNRFEPVTPPEEEIDKKLQEINKTVSPKTDDKL
ncbi:MAG: SMC-Scp complex subunit ScpB [Clostridia bacterium]|nr:SMC-Scp complex subunit ScpB [Clostridia bacterium]